MEKEYCNFCGKEKILVHHGFNTKTGEPELVARCVNPQCGKGCTNTGGHYGWGAFCKKCGAPKVIT